MRWNLFKFFLFLLPPKVAHRVVIWWLKIYQKLPVVGTRESVELIGVAAGFDRNAEVYNGLYRLGFNTVEIGTVTPVSEKIKRLKITRLDHVNSLQTTNMRFPSSVGAKKIAKRLQKNPKAPGLELGINIGKNTGTSTDEAHMDYVKCILALQAFADYFVINLCDTSELKKTLEACKRVTNKKLYVKLASGLSWYDLRDIVEICKDKEIAGIIATNTLGNGISGKLLFGMSLRTVEILGDLVKGSRLEIIGVGGVDSWDDIREFLCAGVNKVQVFTGLVYNGTKWLKTTKHQ